MNLSEMMNAAVATTRNITEQDLTSGSVPSPSPQLRNASTQSFPLVTTGTSPRVPSTALPPSHILSLSSQHLLPLDIQSIHSIMAGMQTGPSRQDAHNQPPIPRPMSSMVPNAHQMGFPGTSGASTTGDRIQNRRLDHRPPSVNNPTPMLPGGTGGAQLAHLQGVRGRSFNPEDSISPFAYGGMLLPLHQNGQGDPLPTVDSHPIRGRGGRGRGRGGEGRGRGRGGGTRGGRRGRKTFEDRAVQTLITSHQVRFQPPPITENENIMYWNSMESGCLLTEDDRLSIRCQDQNNQQWTRVVISPDDLHISMTAASRMSPITACNVYAKVLSDREDHILEIVECDEHGNLVGPTLEAHKRWKILKGIGFCDLNGVFHPPESATSSLVSNRSDESSPVNPLAENLLVQNHAQAVDSMPIAAVENTQNISPGVQLTLNITGSDTPSSSRVNKQPDVQVTSQNSILSQASSSSEGDKQQEVKTTSSTDTPAIPIERGSYTVVPPYLQDADALNPIDLSPSSCLEKQSDNNPSTSTAKDIGVGITASSLPTQVLSSLSSLQFGTSSAFRVFKPQVNPQTSTAMPNGDGNLNAALQSLLASSALQANSSFSHSISQILASHPTKAGQAKINPNSSTAIPGDSRPSSAFHSNSDTNQMEWLNRNLHSNPQMNNHNFESLEASPTEKKKERKRKTTVNEGANSPNRREL